MKVFAERLTQLRESRDLSKTELAKILHVSDSCISQYEKDTSMPGHDTLLSIARYFGVSVDYLLGNKSNTLVFSPEDDFCDGVNYYTFLSDCKKLSPAKRRALLAMIRALLEE